MCSYDMNERLLAAVHSCDFEEALACIIKGARPTYVSPTCGRTAVGMAALVGDVELLELLLQSCEEPELEFFNSTNSTSSDMDTTPDGMDNLEWEDEFYADTNDSNDDETQSACASVAEEDASLYYYYAKTFERTGEIIANNEATASGYSVDDHEHSRTQDPHTTDSILMSPLHYAAECGHLQCVNKLLEHGAPIDVYNSDGYTPLLLATAYADVIHALVKFGANINIKTICSGKTVLHLAIENRSTATSQLLLQTNININETDDNEQTPLMYALINSMDDIAHNLIIRGARVNIHDSQGRTALYYAVHRNNTEMAKLLLEYGARRITEHYLLHHCVSLNWLQMARILIERAGDSLCIRNRDGYTPILLAIVNQKADMLAYFLQVTPRSPMQLPTTRSDCMDNELMVAVQYISDLDEFKSVARTLLQHSEASRGALFGNNAMSHVCYVPYCHTPLSRAINLHKLNFAEFLLKEGCSIDQICHEHIVNNLRAETIPNYSIHFGSLLVHAGFKFPYKRCIQLPGSNSKVSKYLLLERRHWTQARCDFEEHMQILCTKPLPLQAMARIVIRQCILNRLKCTKHLQIHKYQATLKQSSFERMIDDIDLPKVLKNYVTHFTDIPSVMD